MEPTNRRTTEPEDAADSGKDALRPMVTPGMLAAGAGALVLGGELARPKRIPPAFAHLRWRLVRR